MPKSLIISVLTGLAIPVLAPSLCTAQQPPAAVSASIPLADAVECHARGGLPHFYKKLSAGEDVKIGYLGGSITEAPGWRTLSLQWFRKEYPKSAIAQIDGSISGTGAEFGAFRVEREILQKDPDLMFIEFATNDGATPDDRIIRAMEGIVRKTRSKYPHTDLCFIYTLPENAVPVLLSGKFQRSASAMERVAEHYGIPSIHLGMEVARLTQQGKLIFRNPKPGEAPADKPVFSVDGIHPNTQTGHPLYMAAIERSLPAIKAASEKPPGAQVIPPPLDPQNMESATLVPFEAVEHTGSWQPLDRSSDAAKQTPKVSGNRWVASAPGDSLSFSFAGTKFGIYSIKGPDIGQFRVTVDSEPPLTVTLFDDFCTAKRYRIKPWIYPKPLADGEHRVKIEILPEPPDKAAILQKKTQIEDPSQYDGVKLYVSDILLLGALK